MTRVSKTIRFIVVDAQSESTPILWPNDPIRSYGMAQGPITDNLLDSSTWDLIADYDVWSFQWARCTVARNTARVTGMKGVNAAKAGSGAITRFFQYMNLNQTIKTANSDDPNDILRAIIADGTLGNPNWNLRQPPPNQAVILEANYKPALTRQVNHSRGAGLNSLGQALWVPFFQQWKAELGTGNPVTDMLVLLSGFFFDNVNQRVPDIFINNGAGQTTNYDMNGDGTADSRADYSATGGSGRLARGVLDFLAYMETLFPGFLASVNSGEWDQDVIGGNASPPMPPVNWPFYQKHLMPMAESRDLSLGFATSSTAYTVNNNIGGIPRLYRGLELQKHTLKPDVGGIKSAVILHSTTVDRAVFTQDDYEYARLMMVLSLMVDRVAFSVTGGVSRPVPVDDRLAYLGDPLTARSMGTLNLTTGGWTPKAMGASGTQQNGVAQFYYVETAEGLASLRADYPPGPYPTAWPGSAPLVNFVLPSPGTGYYWAMYDGLDYVNPKTFRRMRNLSPAVNTGAAVTSVPMGCLTGRVFQKKKAHPVWIDSMLAAGVQPRTWQKISGPTVAPGLTATNTLKATKTVNPNDANFQNSLNTWDGAPGLCETLGGNKSFIFGLGGAHLSSSYSGNDLFRFDVETRGFSQLRPAFANYLVENGTENAFGEFSDGSIKPKHSYFSDCCTPPLPGFPKGLLISQRAVSNTLDSTQDAATPYPHYLDLANPTGQWVRGDVYPKYLTRTGWKVAPGGMWVPKLGKFGRYLLWGVANGGEVMASWDPLAAPGSQWTDHDPANASGTHTWNGQGIEPVLMIDKVRNIVIAFDWRSATKTQRYLKISNLADYFQSTNTAWTIAEVGTVPSKHEGGGFGYSPLRKAGIWYSGMTTAPVYEFKYESGVVGSLNVAGTLTYRWTNLLNTAANTMSPETQSANDSKVYNRFQVFSWGDGYEVAMTLPQVNGPMYGMILTVPGDT